MATLSRCPPVALAMVVAAALVVTTGRTVLALSPTVMMFHGAPLARPVFVTGADTLAFGDLVRVSPVRPAEMTGRAFIAVALFWGPAHDPALNGRALTQLTPEMAWQHGRFYPAANGGPAVLLVTSLVKTKQHQNASSPAAPAPTEAAAFFWGGPIASVPAPLLDRLRPSR